MALIEARPQSPTGPIELLGLDVAAVIPAFLRPFLRLVPQVSRYTVVSILALGLDTSVTLGLATLVGQATLSAIVGYSIGMILHYFLSVRFVFDAHASRKSRRRQFAEFALSGLVGLAMTAGVIELATAVFGLPLIVAKIPAVIMSFIAVFVLRATIVFAKRA